MSVDVPWSPYDVDGRNYEWHALAAAADLLFVMDYDSMVRQQCLQCEQMDARIHWAGWRLLTSAHRLS